MYSYEDQKPWLFTDEGQRAFLRVRDFATAHLPTTGAVRCHELMGAASAGDNWKQLACVDRLVELRELREVTGPDVAGQDRVFVTGHHR